MPKELESRNRSFGPELLLLKRWSKPIARLPFAKAAAFRRWIFQAGLAFAQMVPARPISSVRVGVVCRPPERTCWARHG